MSVIASVTVDVSDTVFDLSVAASEDDGTAILLASRSLFRYRLTLTIVVVTRSKLFWGFEGEGVRHGWSNIGGLLSPLCSKRQPLQKSWDRSGTTTGRKLLAMFRSADSESRTSIATFTDTPMKPS